MLFVIVAIFAEKCCFSPECFHFPSVVCFSVLPSGPVNNVDCLKEQKFQTQPSPMPAVKLSQVNTFCSTKIISSHSLRILWGQGGLLPWGVKRPWHEANHFHVVPRLRICGSVTLLPYMPSWLAERQRYPYFLTTRFIFMISLH
jgi:hypothetical protein